MSEKYTREKFFKLFKNLPPEIQEMLSAEETSNNIYEICKKNGTEEKLDEIVEYVSQVLLGVLPPEEFQETLEKESKFKKELAKKVSQEINRFIFFPVKESLAALYGKEIFPTAGKVVPPPSKVEEISHPGEKPEEKEEKPSPPTKSDVYRESVE